jgi:hypothetical protein
MEPASETKAIRIGSPRRVARRLAIRYVRLYISLGRT